jgi:glycosyltransferase involved in cell wall biosynthesis
MNLPPRLLLLIPHLGGGGAEQVMAQVAAGLSAEKYDLHLALLTQMEIPAQIQLPPSVQVHALGARRVRGGAIPLLRLVHKIKPDLILSGIFHANFLVLLLAPFFPSETRILVRQNGTVSSALNFGGLPWYTRLLYRLLYRRAERVICQTPSMAEDLVRESRLAQDRITVLPNPVDVESIRNFITANPARQSAFGAPPQLLAIGRLSREKGFDLLLHALALLRSEIPLAQLVMAGSGPEEASLKAECRRLGLDSAVQFTGYLAEPWACFPQASLFVLSSRHEGLPNALLEAAAAGLPIVALPASMGLVDVLDGQSGVWLASEITAEALAASLLSALRALQPQERFAHAWVEAYRMQDAIQAYERLIAQTIAAKR